MTEETPKRTRKPKVTESDLIECITLRRVGLEDRTSDVGETVQIPRKDARVLQDAGAIKVVI